MVRGHERDTDGDDDPTATAPARPRMADEPAASPLDWPAPRELETGEDMIPIQERG